MDKKRVITMLRILLIISSILVIYDGLLFLAISIVIIPFLSIDNEVGLLALTCLFRIPLSFYTIYCGFKGILKNNKIDILHSLKKNTWILLVLQIISALINISLGGKLSGQALGVISSLMFYFSLYFLKKARE